MSRSIYSDFIAIFLLLSAACHLIFPVQTGRWMSRPGPVQIIGGCLLVMALPCLWWRGWYCWMLFAGLVASGVWRLFFPQHSIRAQERTYPRWVHGCIMLGAALGVWALRP